ncbi:MAG: HAMP domain-containing histidine kinase [Clostridium sp.]|jgi:signal transduction histidine kinase|nr:HAMP domain-containing histidine kinase [Clostridium sp.]
MKFKTRLRIIFAMIIFLPLVLTALAFLIINVNLMRIEEGYAIDEVDYTFLSETAQLFVRTVDKIYSDLRSQAETSPSLLEDRSYLARINSELPRHSTFLLVRKGDEIYYSGNMEEALQLFGRLPAYGNGNIADNSGYYDTHLKKYLKQIDFAFSDGAAGSLFVISRVQALISRSLLINMFVAIILILVFTGFTLTQWFQKSLFKPISRLNIAMRRIKEENFDYVLQTDGNGELGDLYRNYEDMRLRLKESTEESIRYGRENRELISNISHDLKTPITAIKGYAEGIMDGVADTPEKIDKYIRTIYNKANDMDRLINELTLYSGIDNNRISYNFHRLNVADYFGDCVEEVGLELEARYILLEYSNLVDPSTIIIADPEQMKRVINNIISNSVKYMDKSRSKIAIRILDEADSVRIEIEDNGKGIAAKDLPRIFERFYRTDTSRNSSQGGSGIGLSIVKKIIEDHGGYIWASSKEGIGTCLHFVIRKYQELAS